MDTEESRWIRSTANELNNLLQVISESTQVLETLHGRSSESGKYFDILRNGIDRAEKATRLMVDRVGGFHAVAGLTSGGAPRLAVLPGIDRLAGGEAFGVSTASPSKERELVMIVDDEDFVTMLAERVLTDEGYRVVTARDGFQAIELYRKLRDEIALIILDFTMPVMDGSDVFDELRLIDPHVPVVLSSGFAEQERLRTMLAKGMRGFIPKPYTQQKLLTQIRATLDALQSERTGARRIL